MYRPRTETPRRKNHLIQSVFFILLVAFSIYVLLQSPLFEVKTFVVDGNRQLDKAEIIRFSGLQAGANIFKLNLAQCEERLTLVPLVKESSIERSLPNKIIIHIKERNAAALLPVENSFIKVDTDGVYLQKGQIASALPIITGLNVKLNGPGKPVEAEYLSSALKALSQLPRPLIMKLSELNINQAGQLSLYTIDGTQGRMGLPTELEYKGSVFLQVLTNLKQSGNQIEYVDLSNPVVPVVKYLKQQGGGQ